MAEPDNRDSGGINRETAATAHRINRETTAATAHRRSAETVERARGGTVDFCIQQRSNAENLIKRNPPTTLGDSRILEKDEYDSILSLASELPHPLPRYRIPRGNYQHNNFYKEGGKLVRVGQTKHGSVKYNVLHSGNALWTIYEEARIASSSNDNERCIRSNFESHLTKTLKLDFMNVRKVLDRIQLCRTYHQGRRCICLIDNGMLDFIKHNAPSGNEPSATSVPPSNDDDDDDNNNNNNNDQSTPIDQICLAIAELTKQLANGRISYEGYSQAANSLKGVIGDSVAEQQRGITEQRKGINLDKTGINLDKVGVNIDKANQAIERLGGDPGAVTAVFSSLTTNNDTDDDGTRRLPAASSALSSASRQRDGEDSSDDDGSVPAFDREEDSSMTGIDNNASDLSLSPPRGTSRRNDNDLAASMQQLETPTTTEGDINIGSTATASSSSRTNGSHDLQVDIGSTATASSSRTSTGGFGLSIEEPAVSTASTVASEVAVTLQVPTTGIASEDTVIDVNNNCNGNNRDGSFAESESESELDSDHGETPYRIDIAPCTMMATMAADVVAATTSGTRDAGNVDTELALDIPADVYQTQRSKNIPAGIYQTQRSTSLAGMETSTTGSGAGVGLATTTTTTSPGHRMTTTAATTTQSHREETSFTTTPAAALGRGGGGLKDVTNTASKSPRHPKSSIMNSPPTVPVLAKNVSWNTPIFTTRQNDRQYDDRASQVYQEVLVPSGADFFKAGSETEFCLCVVDDDEIKQSYYFKTTNANDDDGELCLKLSSDPNNCRNTFEFNLDDLRNDTAGMILLSATPQSPWTSTCLCYVFDPSLAFIKDSVKGFSISQKFIYKFYADTKCWSVEDGAVTLSFNDTLKIVNSKVNTFNDQWMPVRYNMGPFRLEESLTYLDHASRSRATSQSTGASNHSYSA